MILADATIKILVKEGAIKVLPSLKAADIRPTGIRIHLGSDLLIPKGNQPIDLLHARETTFKKVHLDRKGFVLNPGDFVLASSLERIKTSNQLVCQIDGRSTFARLG